MAYGFNDDKSKADLKAAVLELAYPVGSIYQSTNNVSPATFLGGTWEEINGRFLVAQGNNGQSGNYALNLSAGATGGEKNHTLLTSEMPSHSHRPGSTGYPPVNPPGFVCYNSTAWRRSIAAGSEEVKLYTDMESVGQTSSEGGNSSHNNLPPYLAVYTWKRTA